MAQIHGKKVLIRKPKAGDLVVTRTNGNTRTVVSVSNGVVIAKGAGFNGIAKAFPLAHVSVLAKRQ